MVGSTGVVGEMSEEEISENKVQTEKIREKNHTGLLVLYTIVNSQ